MGPSSFLLNFYERRTTRYVALLIGQKAFIRRGEEVLVVFDPVLGLDFPGGRIKTGETDPGAALKREVQEETSLTVYIESPFAVWFRKVPAHARKSAGEEIYIVGFRCKYLSGEVSLSGDHDSYRWVRKETYRELDDGSEYFRALQKYFEE